MHRYVLALVRGLGWVVFMVVIAAISVWLDPIATLE